jgi:hypothetical protein
MVVNDGRSQELLAAPPNFPQYGEARGALAGACADPERKLKPASLRSSDRLSEICESCTKLHYFHGYRKGKVASAKPWKPKN